MALPVRNRRTSGSPASSPALGAVAAVVLALLLLPAASGAGGPVLPPPPAAVMEKPLASDRPAGEGREPDRYGMTVGLGSSQDPVRDIRFVLISAFGLFDYGKVWGRDRPRELCFKVEGAAGGTVRPDRRAIVSLGAAVLYYLPPFAGPAFRPYAEAGIGVIYTDFQVRDQGLRINFNPQLGIGTEVTTEELGNFFTALRVHHLSNGGLHHDNRGVNSLILQIGRYY
ncbi:MAG: acyloxyacyl hydrolase [bacterium]